MSPQALRVEKQRALTTEAGLGSAEASTFGFPPSARQLGRRVLSAAKNVDQPKTYGMLMDFHTCVQL